MGLNQTGQMKSVVKRYANYMDVLKVLYMLMIGIYPLRLTKRHSKDLIYARSIFQVVKRFEGVYGL